MRRSAVNLLIDVITLLVFFAMVWTGCLMHYVLPAGGGRGHTLTLWGMNRHEYGKVHFYLALAMVALIIVHLWLHWPWICSTMSNLLGAQQPKRFKRALYGMILLLVMVIATAGSLLWSETKVKYTYGEDPARYEFKAFEIDELPDITGRTTLSQAAEMAGISVEQLISKLQLPSDINPNERLGRLRWQYGFKIEDVKRIASQEINRLR